MCIVNRRTYKTPSKIGKAFTWSTALSNYIITSNTRITNQKVIKFMLRKFDSRTRDDDRSTDWDQTNQSTSRYTVDDATQSYSPYYVCM